MSYKEENDKYKDLFAEAEGLAKLNFDSKDSYLMWRKVWKILYKDISDRIRYCKVNRSPLVQNTEYWIYQSFRETYRRLACDMMIWIERAKTKSFQIKLSVRLPQ